MRLLAAIRNDIRLQYRHGFYAAYLVVSVAYIAVARVLPEPAREVFLPLILFTDPAVLGFFFLGALVLLERGDRTLDALFVTPTRTWEYLAAKVCSLTLLSLLTCLGIAFAAAGTSFDPIVLTLGVVLVSPLFVLIGVIAVSRTTTVNRYLFTSIIYLTPLMAPLLDFFGLAESSLFFPMPTGAGIELVAGAFSGSITTARLSAAIAILLAWNVVAYLWAHTWLERHIIGRVAAGPVEAPS